MPHSARNHCCTVKELAATVKSKERNIYLMGFELESPQQQPGALPMWYLHMLPAAKKKSCSFVPLFMAHHTHLPVWDTWPGIRSFQQLMCPHHKISRIVNWDRKSSRIVHTTLHLNEMAREWNKCIAATENDDSREAACVPM